MKDLRVVWALKQFFSPRVLPVLLGALVLVGLGPEAALAEGAESLINFTTVRSEIEPLLKSAITVAASFGAVVVAAVLCWKFFKRFLQG